MQNKKKGEAGIGTAGRPSRRIVKLKDLRLEMISNFDIYNPRADKNGYVKEWVARNEWGNAVAFGNTKAECLRYTTKQVRKCHLGASVVPVPS